MPAEQDRIAALEAKLKEHKGIIRGAAAKILNRRLEIKALEAKVDQMEAENLRLREALARANYRAEQKEDPALMKRISDAIGFIEGYKKQVAELREDRERLDWLMKRCNEANMTPEDHLLTRERIDEARMPDGQAMLW